MQWLTVPFAVTNPAVSSLSLNQTDWLGSIPPSSPEWGIWIDYWLLLICGGIPWQVVTIIWRYSYMLLSAAMINTFKIQKASKSYRLMFKRKFSPSGIFSKGFIV